MKIQISDNVCFAYERDLEYIAVAAGLFSDNLDGRICREIYCDEFIIELKSKHREIVELLKSLSLGGLEIIESLMAYNKEFHLQEYIKHLKKMPQNQFLFEFFGNRSTLEEINQALVNEEILLKLYDEDKFRISSYISLKAVIQHREEILDKYFACIQALKTPELEEYLDEYEKLLPNLQHEIEDKFKNKNAIEVMEDIVQKKFLEKKEYENYTFMPVCMLPRNAVQYYYNNTIILYSHNRIINRKKAFTMLKVIADETRIRIIDLLTERGCENGKNLSICLQLAPSTVSYHMEQMVECGIVKEEKRGNAKYYAINQENGINLIGELGAIILKNKDY